MLKIVAISDLHLGEPDSVLHTRYPRIMVEFAERLNGLAGANGETTIDTLVLMGDIPDYTLASWETCHRNLRQFFDAILLGRFTCPEDGKAYTAKKTRVRQVLYVPGNHDHALWTHMLEQLLLPQGVRLAESQGHPIGLGRLEVKAPSLAAQSLRWIPDAQNGQVPPVELRNLPLFYRSSGAARPQWGLSPGPNTTDVPVGSYFLSSEALHAVESFAVQYPHYYTSIGSRGYLFQHGQYLSATVVGKASKYAPQGLEFVEQGGSPAVKGLAELLDGFVVPHKKGSPVDEAAADQALESALKQLSPEELRLLAESLDTALMSPSAEALGLEGNFTEKAGRAWSLIAGKVRSLRDCYTKYRADRPLAEGSLLDVEAKTALFMDNLWEPACNCDKPINDRFWNGVGRFEQFAEVMNRMLGAQANHKISSDFRFLIERYLEKLSGLPQEVVFVYGDTHRAATRTFEDVHGKVVRVFNTGAWHAKIRDWQHGAKFFTVSENETCELMDVHFSEDTLKDLKPFVE
jgi:UDP-2,3-diacylglucosamine pyrophosphatase LpxH